MKVRRMAEIKLLYIESKNDCMRRRFRSMNKKTKVLLSIIALTSIFFFGKITYHEQYIKNKISSAILEKEKLETELSEYKNMSDNKKGLNDSFNSCLTSIDSLNSQLNFIDKIFNTNNKKDLLYSIDYLNKNFQQSYQIAIQQGKLINNSIFKTSDILSIIKDFKEDDYLKQISVVLRKKDGNTLYYNNDNLNKKKSIPITWYPTNVKIDEDLIVFTDEKILLEYLNNKEHYKSYIGLNKNNAWTAICFEEV
ncbi:hypothetical protein U732_55 [Clostridium argentinense CDC 2741]|uniref:Uncharacterized protein n=3 Tax=Clostridium argentinense TaxID=29341 RepID=A0A0C1TZI7_9CLOT|nr:hypothetical protein [Clostridium argentinense]KIE44713.1 hypothetical protein U732_55 [Clostridium argentinense CDC 2741]